MKMYAVFSYLKVTRLGYPNQKLPLFQVDECRKISVDLQIYKQRFLKQ